MEMKQFFMLIRKNFNPQHTTKLNINMIRGTIIFNHQLQWVSEIGI